MYMHFKQKQTFAVATTASSDVEKLNKLLLDEKNAAHLYQLEASYKSGQRDSEISLLKEQVKALSQQRDDLARLLIQAQSEQATSQAEISALKGRITTLENERDAAQRLADLLKAQAAAPNANSQPAPSVTPIPMGGAQ